MNIKEYISSGIIESYVLGLITDAEREEFERMCKQYPEVAEARNDFELKLEQQLLGNSIEPPAHIKEKVQDSLKKPDVTHIEESSQHHQVVPVRRLNFWKIAAAASLILLAGTICLITPYKAPE